MLDYRPLTTEETALLTANGCRAQDWNDVQVKDGFDPVHYNQVTFSGQVHLGRNEKSLKLPDGRTMPAGIRNAAIHDSTIGNNVYIANIHGVIACYRIEEESIIENVGSLQVTGESSFGNGVRVKVINENGGREVPIYDKLSAQTAYLLAFYRHRKQLVDRLEKMIDRFADSVISGQGSVGAFAIIRNCGTLRNINIGPCAEIEGATWLENGSINSESESPAKIGPGVIAKNFITAQGSVLTDGAIVENFFLGQAAIVGSGFSAMDALVFSNSKCLNGEACSAFLGPFSMTDHKSTLLIAGMVSFWNAGSGTNQSNHLYKLGPMHQGIMERGCKTASSAYVMWPANIGAFTLIMGRVYSHPDTSALPFSYLVGKEDDGTILVPGINLKSVGLYRDDQKWPDRDKRQAAVKLDRLRPDVFNPYTVDKMINGKTLLESLLLQAGQDKTITWNGCQINVNALTRCMDLYDRSITIYLGNVLFSALQQSQEPLAGWQKSLKNNESRKIAEGEWLDLAGMIAPRQAMENVMQDLESGAIGGLAQWRPIVCGIHHNYQAFVQQWTLARLATRTGIHPAKWTVDNLNEFSTQYQRALSLQKDDLVQDASKDFSPEMMIGYGMDGDDDIALADFTAVHGNLPENKYVHEIEDDFAEKFKIVTEVLARQA